MRDERTSVKLTAEEVEHIKRWAEKATPYQVAAAMREKLRLEKVLKRTVRTPEAP